ncbi:MAG: hypothetical protein J6C63_07230 [Lachnospiraceae bacterium]|nr:hypothetical protein [Lachnospiraceae bacterium]
MERIKTFVLKNWYILFVAMLLCMQTGVFLIFREGSYIQVHDNLDLFASQLQIMKNTDTFFAHDVLLPMLGGISRNNFGSEFSLYNILFYFLPNFWAYMAGYALKIAIGIFSLCLLAKDVYGEKYETYRPLVLVVATAYGLIPVFPAYGIAFTSVPLIVYLLRRIYIQPNKWLYLGVFLYPLLSYFSYFGIFLLAYVVLAVVILWIRDKRFPKGIMLSLFLLAAGYIVFEHRLFKEMLFSDVVTIRGSMVSADLSLAENLKSVWAVFTATNFHEQDSHMYLVLPVCLIGLVLINFGYIRRKEYKKIWTDSCNLVLGLIVFNCVVYGLYDWKAFRDLVEAIVPQLTGFQFNRFTFFNPFLWYALLFLVVKRMYDSRKKMLIWAANGIVMSAALIVMFKPQMYNDFYNTCYYNAYSILKQTKVNDLNYEEYYSQDLFTYIKEEIDYDGEWSAAYGLNPAILQYNGIATVDGYLGMYSQEYKEAFRKVIAPALETAPGNRIYFDNWGARAYLFSGADESTYAPYRDLGLTDNSLQIDTEAYKAIGGQYIFSRIELSNSEELGLVLKGVYSQDSSPYTIYLYEAP